MQKLRTNSARQAPSDWSALAPVLPAGGPRGRALHAELRGLIETRRFAPGDRLPPSPGLASRLGVSRGAVVAAYDQLIAEGYAQARRGAGTFVSADAPELARPPAAPARPAPPPTRPGRVGSGTADEATLRVLRRLYRLALSRPPDSFLHYGDPQGDRALRAEIAAYLRAARGMNVHPDQVVITGGTLAALDLVARACLRPGDAVWMENPCYPRAYACLSGAGMRIVPVPVDAQGLDLDKGAALEPGAKAVFLTPSHQFPLGVTMTMARRVAMLDWAERAGAWIIEDDYDSEFRYSGPPLAALHSIDGGRRVIYLGTFSKALAPGVRLGYAVLPEPLLAPVLALRARTDTYPNPLTETVMTAFLREGHYAAHLKRARKRARAARDALVEGLAQGPFAATAPDQGLHLIAAPPPGMTEAEALTIADRAGLTPRSLSSMYLAGPAREGLVIGFSGFAPEALYEAAARTGAAK